MSFIQLNEIAEEGQMSDRLILMPYYVLWII